MVVPWFLDTANGSATFRQLPAGAPEAAIPARLAEPGERKI
jgi:hypothetical protein